MWLNEICWLIWRWFLHDNDGFLRIHFCHCIYLYLHFGIIDLIFTFLLFGFFLSLANKVFIIRFLWGMNFFHRILGPDKFSINCNFIRYFQPKPSFKKCNNQIPIIAITHKYLNFTIINFFWQLKITNRDVIRIINLT